MFNVGKKPVEDEEAQFDLVEDERAMSMVRRNSNPPFRLLGVPGFNHKKRDDIIPKKSWVVPGLPSTHGFLSSNGKECMNLHKQGTIIMRLDLGGCDFDCTVSNRFKLTTRSNTLEKGSWRGEALRNLQEV